MRGEVRAGRRDAGAGAAAARAACTGKVRLKAWGPHGTRGAHDEHVSHMSGTLEVSKLSGWLNADACCRVERMAYGVCQCGPRCKLGGGRAWSGEVWGSPHPGGRGSKLLNSGPPLHVYYPPRAGGGVKRNEREMQR